VRGSEAARSFARDVTNVRDEHLPVDARGDVNQEILMRLLVITAAFALLAACAKEPKGTPVALEGDTAKNKSDLAGEWTSLAFSLEKEERWSESLFAANQGLTLIRECMASTDTPPECQGFLESNVPNLGGLGFYLLWKRRAEETLTLKARVLIELGHPKFGLKVAQEAIQLNDTFLPPRAQKAEALFRLARYEEALVANKETGRTLFGHARAAHILAHEETR
jgi:hypothetical protein